MPAPTGIAAVTAAVSSLVAGLGYTPTLDQFGFDLQPADNIDLTFRVQSPRTGLVGCLGPNEILVHKLDIWIARAVNAEPADVENTLWEDLRQIEVGLDALQDVSDLLHVYDDSVQATVGLVPGTAPDYLAGHFSCMIDFDAALALP